jgi:hypothetical protein
MNGKQNIELKRFVPRSNFTLECVLAKIKLKFIEPAKRNTRTFYTPLNFIVAFQFAVKCG